MTKLRSVIAKSAVVFGLTLASAAVQAEYDTVKLRQVAGGYLDAIAFVTQVKQSECGYLFPTEPDSFALALADMVGYVSDDDINEIRAFLQSREFRDVQSQQKRIVRDWLASSRRSSGELSACATAVTSARRMYDDAKQSWLAAKEFYGK